MTLDETMAALEAVGSEQTKKTHLRHGATEPLFGVKVADMKLIAKRTGIDHPLAKALYASGNYDACYLASHIVDDAKTTKTELNVWVKQCVSGMLSEYAVPWCAAESRFGVEVATAWIKSPKPHIAAAGWNTFAVLVAITPDDDLDTAQLTALLSRVGSTIHDQPNRVRYCMNGFLIAVGSYSKPLAIAAIRTAKAVGTVVIDHGDTACDTPNAVEAIRKTQARGTLIKKRKHARC